MFDIIMGCANKTCSLGCMPTLLLKSSIEVVFPYVKDIVNMSLRDGVLPHILKQAIVTPIITKTTLDRNELKKIIDQCLTSVSLEKYVKKNDLNEVFQSAYKNKHSTERLCSRFKTMSPVHWIKITLPS